MKVYIWSPRPSKSALMLRDCLKAAGIEAVKQRKTRRKPARADDIWLNWGPPYEPANTWPGVKILNGIPALNKRDQLIKLAAVGIPCPEVFSTPASDRLGRSFRHQCASDLLSETGRDYYTQRLDITYELRIHIFEGKAIHSGRKVERDVSAHPWIRSSNSGWKIDYSRAKDIRSDRRELAKNAVAALGLSFGAVDIGILVDKSAVIIEVNTAPGLDKPTAEAYVRQLMKGKEERE